MKVNSTNGNIFPNDLFRKEKKVTLQIFKNQYGRYETRSSKNAQ